MTIFVGTSGWQYRHWRGVCYPPRMRQAEWLAHYAARFATVEVNSTFYRLPERATFAAWRSSCALRDAWRFAHACRRLGLTVARVPAAQPIPNS